MILAGGVVHLGMILLPIVCLGLAGTSLADPAVIAFLVGATALYAGDVATMRWTRPTLPSSQNARAARWAALTGGVLLMTFWAALVERALDAPSPSWGQVAGAVVLVSGVIVRALAVRTLGRDFRTEIDVPDALLLVRHGVYRFVRHPSETGLLAVALGAAALLQSLTAVLMWCAVLVPATLYRLSLEERALEERFGDAYTRYADAVGGLVPLLKRGL